MLHIAEGEIYKAPLINPGRALDLGTGSGLWSVDFASKHPECEVIGVDLRCVFLDISAVQGFLPSIILNVGGQSLSILFQVKY